MCQVFQSQLDAACESFNSQLENVLNDALARMRTEIKLRKHLTEEIESLMKGIQASEVWSLLLFVFYIGLFKVHYYRNSKETQFRPSLGSSYKHF